MVPWETRELSRITDSGSKGAEKGRGVPTGIRREGSKEVKQVRVMRLGHSSFGPKEGSGPAAGGCVVEMLGPRIARRGEISRQISIVYPVECSAKWPLIFGRRGHALGSLSHLAK